MGRGARRVHARDRRPLRPRRDPRDDGDELTRVVRATWPTSWACPGTPEQINAAIVTRMLARYGASPPLIPGAVDVVRRRRAARPVAIASSSNIELIEVVLAASGLAGGRARGRLLRAGRARQAGARRLPRGGAQARSRAVSLRRRRGLAQRHSLREGGGDGRLRDPEPALPAGRRRTRGRRRRAAVARRAAGRAPSRPGRAGRSRCGRRGPSRSRAPRRAGSAAPRSARSRGRIRDQARDS